MDFYDKILFIVKEHWDLGNNFYMSDIAQEINLVSIEEELKNSYLDYAMSVIVGRALPDIRDGLKPVHRRVLYAMNVLKNDWNKPYKKSARIVGDVIGKYHPHGDTAVYDAIVRLAQSFSMRYLLIDGQGNFGSVDGDPPAAMRYTEVRMSKIAHELLEDLHKNTVRFVPNYDESEKIPEILPTRIPNLLINGSSGIAVGMATNIPPHNLVEVINACLAYTNDKDISIEKLGKYILGPDFPTSAIIYGKSGISEAYHTGKGKIYIRASTKIVKNLENKKEVIIVDEIPYQVNKSRLIKDISELVKNKRIEGISGLRDESDKDGMRIVIEIKRDSFAKVVLNNLYLLTQLQVSFCINMVALYKGKPKLLNLKDVIKSFINHRKEIIVRRSTFDLNKAKKRVYVLEALVVALSNINKVIEIICQSKNPDSARLLLLSRSWSLSKSVSKILESFFDDKIRIHYFEKSYFMIKNRRYYLNDFQVQAILDLRLQKLTTLENEKILNEYNELSNKIKDLLFILTDENKLIEVIQTELKFIKEEYFDIRRTKIIQNCVDEIKTEDLINKEDVVITLSHYGYIKYQVLSSYEAQKRGGKGKLAAYIKEEDFIENLLIANTHDIILCFSSFGKLYYMKVYQLPESNRTARGKPIINLLKLEKDERITTILPVRKFYSNCYVFMVTENGLVKKTLLKDFNRSKRNNGIIAINLNKGDKLISVNLTFGNDDVMLFSSFGRVVRFSEREVRPVKRNAAGIRGIKLYPNDKVVSLIIPSRLKGDILTITENGYGKRTNQNKYPKKSRSTKGVISIKINQRNGNVVGAIQVKENDEIMMITSIATLVRTRVSEISIFGRNTQGVILIRVSEGEKVVSLQKIVDLKEKIEQDSL